MVVPAHPFDKKEIEKGDCSIWRYRSFFPAEIQQTQGSLGAGGTPLLPTKIDDREIYLKLDYLNPTASFKDRGVELMMSALALAGVEEVVEDSSGNAGASVAAYAARLGMRASIFSPTSASAAKLAQIAIYGANIHTIPGERQNATEAAYKALEEGMVYASHTWNPIYLLGQQTAALEVWEQHEQRAPEWVVIPVGQGGNLLGYYEGFRVLLEAGLIKRLPRIVAVQPQKLAPICDAFENDWKEWPEISPPWQGSIAEGLAITHPVRWQQVLHAIKESAGFCVRVSEEDIFAAQNFLARKGFYVEPTSAVVMAAFKEVKKFIERDQFVVFSLTGSGLKTNPKIDNNVEVNEIKS